MGSGELAKAVVIDTIAGESHSVMYNPEELKLEQGNSYAEVGIPGRNAPPLQYVRGKARALSMELFFDTYEENVDVRRYTGPFVNLLEKSSATQGPPVLLFSMGAFQFQCVLVDAAQRFTMFARDGTPVRSTISARFQEFVRIDVEIRQGLFFGSPTVSAVVNAGVTAVTGGSLSDVVHVLLAGDTLSGLAGAYLGDPGLWRDIARANGIVDPLALTPGQTLMIPARSGGRVVTDFFAPRFEVRVSGVTLAADLADQILSLTVETDLDVAGTFGLVLRNPDNRLLDSPLLDLGKTVEIHLGYGGELVPAFLGEIAAVEPSFPASGPPTVRLTGYDKSFKLRRNQPGPTDYAFMSDSLVAARIAVENGLVPVVDPTPVFTEKITQVESDMAFLKSRARQYFFDVYVEWDRLHFQFPRPQTAAYMLEWGTNLTSFEPRISAAGLAGLQVIRGYNQELAQTVYAATLAMDLDPANLLEKIGSSAVDLLTGLVRKGIRTHSVDNPLSAVELAQALLQNVLEGLYEGDGECIGLPALAAGQYLEIRGVGKRFGGTYRVRKVTHKIDDNGFSTHFSITQRSHSSLMGMLRKQLVEEPSPNRAQPFFGVVLAEVVDNHEVLDTPPKVPLGRVKVTYPGLSEDFTSGWAPVVRPMAGDGSGFYALPDKGDQVLVAFEHGDLAKPYVLGSLWTVKQSPPEKNTDGRNAKRVIKSPSGHLISFDDTPGAGKVVVQDAKGSAVTLDSSDGSVTLSAATKLTLRAKGDISIEAEGGATKISMTTKGVEVT